MLEARITKTQSLISSSFSSSTRKEGGTQSAQIQGPNSQVPQERETESTVAKWSQDSGIPGEWYFSRALINEKKKTKTHSYGWEMAVQEDGV